VRKLERNVGTGAAVLSAIIGIREHAAGISQSSVRGMNQANAYRRVTTSTPAGSQTLNIQKMQPGSWLDVGSGRKYHPSPLANQGVGQSVVTIEQALLRSVGGNWCMPEYMISGDASNANYSSTLVAESPFVKFCKRRQKVWCAIESAMFWKVIAIAARAGRFRQWGVWEVGELEKLVELQVRGPIVEARDRPAETNRRAILYNAGGISLETWLSEEGYDFGQERAKRAEEPSQGPVAVPGSATQPGPVQAAAPMAEGGVGSGIVGHTTDGPEGGLKRSGTSLKSALAKDTFKPSTKAKQDQGDASQRDVAKRLGHEVSGDNSPMDVVGKDAHGKPTAVEVKTLCDQKNDKLTMHPDAKARKDAYGVANGATLWTVAVDNRDTFNGGAHVGLYSGNKIYLKEGVGSYRVSSMTPVSEKELAGIVSGRMKLSDAAANRGRK